MSEIQQELETATETMTQSDSETAITNESGHVVPVTEAIKYRKRAQAAEGQLEQLSDQLNELEKEQTNTQTLLKNALLEQEMMTELVKAGTMDIEVAMLLAKQKLASCGDQEQNTQKIIQQLQQERPSLFANNSGVNLGGPTFGARSPNGGHVTKLKRLAEQVTHSGNRKDMQEYLKLRRTIQR